jgi:hypothetical protein
MSKFLAKFFIIGAVAAIASYVIGSTARRPQT